MRISLGFVKMKIYALVHELWAPDLSETSSDKLDLSETSSDKLDQSETSSDKLDQSDCIIRRSVANCEF